VLIDLRFKTGSPPSMEIQTKIKKSTSRLPRNLAGFAAFILNHHFEDFIELVWKNAEKLNLPLLKYLTDVGQDELSRFRIRPVKEMLTALRDNDAENFINISTEKWQSNEIPFLLKDQIVIEDITLINAICKKPFLNFLPLFTTDPYQIISVAGEIDDFFYKLESSTVSVFIQFLNEKVGHHLHFTERITDTTPGIIYLFNLKTRNIEYVNMRAKELFGYGIDELKSYGNNVITQLMHPEDALKLEDWIESFNDVADRELRSFDFRLRKKDGEYRWVRNYISVFRRNPNGSPAEAIGIAVDIHDEKGTSEMLLSREEQLLEAQELAEMGSYEINLETFENVLTPQVKKILQLDNNNTLSNYFENIHPADRPRVRKAIDDAVKSKGGFDCEYRYAVNDFEKIIWSKGNYAEVNGSPVLKVNVMDVTERHHMIQRLQRSDDLYKQAQGLSHIGNWIWDLRNDKFSWSDELYRIYEVEPGSPVDLNIFQSKIHPDDLEMVKDQMDNLRLTNHPYDFDYRIIVSDGKIKYLNAKGEIRLDENKKAYKMIGTVQDISAQKQIEVKLQENQNFIRKIADATPSIIAAYDINTGKYVFINQAIRKLLGYDPQQIIDEGASFFMKILHPDDIERVMQQNQNALEYANSHIDSTNEIIVEFKYRLKHIDGRYHWFHTYGTVFDRNTKGEVQQVLNISLDITDRIEAEEKIKEQEYLIRHIADASPTILYLYDLPSGSILYINNEVESVLGYTPEEIFRMKEEVNRLFNVDDLQKVKKENPLRKKGKENVLQYECRVSNSEGQWRWLLINEIVTKKENGQSRQILGAALDITGRKEMERALHQKTYELQQSNASLEEFAYVASHDLKEPLRKISAFGDRLQHGYYSQLDETGKMFLDKIINSSKRMQQMVDDLLSLSMISADKKFQKADLTDILNEVLKTLEIKIEEKKAVIVSDKLPVATVVPSQIFQLFQNILSNSLKFTRPGVTPEINIGIEVLDESDVKKYFPLAKAQKLLHLVFSDNGIGFAPEYSERIFSIFQRLHGRSEYEGTGIGLAICKKIVENHGGIIRAKGQPGSGSSFEIFIPG
jgi:PAS domain S-box-containing protein